MHRWRSSATDEPCLPMMALETSKPPTPEDGVNDRGSPGGDREIDEGTPPHLISSIMSTTGSLFDPIFEGLMNRAHISSIRSLSRRRAPRRAHSHTIKTRQPPSTNALTHLSSRCRFPEIFALQNSVRVAGNLNNEQSCPCQKHPCTNRHT
jgi:hypothetical protein